MVSTTMASINTPKSVMQDSAKERANNQKKQNLQYA